MYFRLETICRRQNKCGSKIEIGFEKGRKHCGKKEKMLVTSIFSFSYNVLNKSFSGSLKVCIVW